MTTVDEYLESGTSQQNYFLATKYGIGSFTNDKKGFLYFRPPLFP